MQLHRHILLANRPVVYFKTYLHLNSCSGQGDTLFKIRNDHASCKQANYICLRVPYFKPGYMSVRPFDCSSGQ